MEIQMIDGNEFILDATPVRQEPIPHICICLLYEETTMEDGEVRRVRDKCTQEIDNPDQAFCDECERAGHHLLDTQRGEARNIHKKGKDA